MSMHSINLYHDMDRFAGCVVAFQDNPKSDTFSDSYTFDETSDIKFATISNTTSRFRGKGDIEERTGYTLLDFIKPRTASMHRGMVNSELQYHQLKMRVATPEEIDKLRNAVESGQASHTLQRNLNWEKIKEVAKSHFQ